MKNKFLLILISVILCLSLSACGFGSPDETTPVGISDEGSTPESTPDSTPESTPTSAPESSYNLPPDTPTESSGSTEPNEDELAILEMLDAVCKEQLVVDDDGPSFKVEYRYIQNYYGEIESGHVFQVYIWRQLDMGTAYSETIGDYYFDLYYGGNRENYIYVYDGEKLIHLPDAYNEGLISDADLDLVFHRWLENRIIENFKKELEIDYGHGQDLSNYYEVLGIELVTESDKFITYAVKVAAKGDENILARDSLALDEFEFEGYGSDTLLYVYHNHYFTGIWTLEEVYENYKTNYPNAELLEKLKTDLVEIQKYWQENCLGK